MKKIPHNHQRGKSTSPLIKQIVSTELKIGFTATLRTDEQKKTATSYNFSSTFPLNVRNSPPPTTTDKLRTDKEKQKNTKGKYTLRPTVLPVLESQQTTACMQLLSPDSKKIANITEIGYFPKPKLPFLGTKQKARLKAINKRFRPVHKSMLERSFKTITFLQDKINKGLSTCISLVCSSKYKVIDIEMKRLPDFI